MNHKRSLPPQSDEHERSSFAKKVRMRTEKEDQPSTSSQPKVESSSHMVQQSASLASSFYLFTALISKEWDVLSKHLILHHKADIFTRGAFTGVHMVITFLKEKLPAKHIDPLKKSDVDEINRLLRLCEASLQFLQSLCQQQPFRESITNDKEFCEDGVVLKLVLDVMTMPNCEDPHFKDVVYRLKTKVLSIMLLICEVEKPSLLDISSRSSESFELIKSTVDEVIQVVTKMLNGDFTEHPRGPLQINAMRLTEIFSYDTHFRSYIIVNLTQALIQLFLAPKVEFLFRWCYSDEESSEEEVFLDFDSISAVGEVLGLFPIPCVPSPKLNAASQIPYAYQRSSLLIRIIANLTCCVPDPYKEKKDLFVNQFLECLKKELPGDAAERTNAVIRNLRSLWRFAEQSLTPEYLNEDDLRRLRKFISQLTQLLGAQESEIHQVKESWERGECSRTAAQRSSGGESDRSALVQLNQLAWKENKYQDVEMEETARGGPKIDGSKSIEMASEVEEMTGNMQSQENQEKRRRKKMNDSQISMIEEALNSDPDMRLKPASIQLWADRLSNHGSEVTPSQLKNWLNNRRARQARTKVASGVEDVIRLVNENGEDIGRGKIHLSRGIWFGYNLEELGLNVVDITDLKVDKQTKLPHPCDATGDTFAQAELILTTIRILWDSNKILSINR